MTKNQIVIASEMKWSEAIPGVRLFLSFCDCFAMLAMKNVDIIVYKHLLSSLQYTTTPSENNRDIADNGVLHDYFHESPILNYVIYKFPWNLIPPPQSS